MTDSELIQRYKDGEKAAFDVLVSRYLKLVYTVVYRFVNQHEAAEDVTQDAFVKAMQAINSFDTNKEFKPWLMTIAKNQARDWLKKKNPVLLAEMSEENESVLMNSLQDVAPTADIEVDLALRSREMNKAIQELTPEQQQIIFLRYMKDFSFKEIAEELGQIANTIKTKHFRAMEALRKIVKKKPLLSE
jgi:RNA polymerase sigma-70 factor (ECF subfamily)